MEATGAAASATNTTQMTEGRRPQGGIFSVVPWCLLALAAGQQPPSRASRKVSSSSCAAASSSSDGTRRQRVKYTSSPRMAVRRLPACSPAEGGGGIGDLVGHVLAARGGQAVQELAAERAELHELAVDLIIRKDAHALFLGHLVFIQAVPDVGIDEVRTRTASRSSVTAQLPPESLQLASRMCLWSALSCGDPPGRSAQSACRASW